MEQASHTQRRYTVVFEPAEEGGYTVFVPMLPGCVTEGDTFEEATENVKDAIKGYLLASKEWGEPLSIEPEGTFVVGLTLDLSLDE